MTPCLSTSRSPRDGRTPPCSTTSPKRLKEKLLDPRSRGEPVWIGGKGFNWEKAELEIYEGPPTTEIEDFAPAFSTEWLTVLARTTNVTDRFIREAPGVAARLAHAPGDADDPRRVMVVHGRDADARADLFNLLNSLGLKPLEFGDAVRATGNAAAYIGEALDAAFSIAQAAVVLFTGDDEARLRPELQREDEESQERELTLRARQNVLFEAGLALGHLPKRTIFLQIGTVRQASDLVGRHAIRVRPGPEWRNEFAQRLREAGCPVDTSSSHWLSVGRFAARPRETRSRDGTEGSGGEAAGEQLLETSAAARRAGLEGNVERDRALLSVLRSTRGSFDAETLRKQLPAPKPTPMEMKRFVAEMFKADLLKRNPDGRGWVAGQVSDEEAEG